MAMFDKLLANLKNARKTIVFTEGTDERILNATNRLLAEDLMDVILCGNVDAVKAAASKFGYNISKATILDPETYEEIVKRLYSHAVKVYYVFVTERKEPQCSQ